MNVEVLAGNILDIPADVLVSTANPWLQMTGGVNLGSSSARAAMMSTMSFRHTCLARAGRWLIPERFSAPGLGCCQ